MAARPGAGGALALPGPRDRSGRGPGAPDRPAGRRLSPAARPRPGHPGPRAPPRRLQPRGHAAAVRRARPVRSHPPHHAGARPVLGGLPRWAGLDLHAPEGGQVPPRPGADGGRRGVLLHQTRGPPAPLGRRRSLHGDPRGPGIPGGTRPPDCRPGGRRPLHRARHLDRGRGPLRLGPGGRPREDRPAGARGGTRRRVRDAARGHGAVPVRAMGARERARAGRQPGVLRRASQARPPRLPHLSGRERRRGVRPVQGRGARGQPDPGQGLPPDHRQPGLPVRPPSDLRPPPLRDRHPDEASRRPSGAPSPRARHRPRGRRLGDLAGPLRLREGHPPARDDGLQPEAPRISRTILRGRASSWPKRATPRAAGWRRS